jgi:hypothetical protein
LDFWFENKPSGNPDDDFDLLDSEIVAVGPNPPFKYSVKMKGPSGSLVVV